MAVKDKFQEETTLLEIGLPDEIMELLEECALTLHLSKAEVARMGIDLVRKEIEENSMGYYRQSECITFERTNKYERKL